MTLRAMPRRPAGGTFPALVVLGLAAALFCSSAAAQRTLEIPVGELEAVEPDGDHKPNPLLEPGHPLEKFFDSGDLDMTGTLPDAVMEHVLGASPFAFEDAVWGLEVSGSWSQSLSGAGTLQVIDLTEGMGATGVAHAGRFTGERGLRTYTARMPLGGEQVFTLSAAFPPSSGTGPGSELDGAKSGFWMYVCHMFERERTGCNEPGRESYHITDTPRIERLQVRGDRGSYSMRFTARVEEYRYERNPGIGGPRKSFTGRVGVVRGWVCEAGAWKANPETCIADAPLRVVDNAPGHERENVNFLAPAVEWEFSAPVDRASLERGFSLTTRDAGNEPVEVAGEIVGGDGNRFAFMPEQELESGVIYEARLTGGEEGVRALDGDAHLDADHRWRFSTILDLERQRGSDQEPLAVRIYQTVRDAPLVTGKPAVIRLYPHWEAHDHIHPTWQPTSFPVDLELNVVSAAQRRVEAQFGGTGTSEALRLQRPDQFNDEHRRLAQHTINVYGWSPAAADAGKGSVEASLAPHDPYPAPLDPAELVVEQAYATWQADPGPLVLRYGLLRVGPWADGVPAAERQVAAAVIREAAAFARQILPIRTATGLYTGVEEARPGRFIAPVKRLLGDMRRRANASPDDVFVVFYPVNALACSENAEGEPVYCGGAELGLRSSTQDPERGIMLAIAGAVDGVTLPVSLQAESLVHELGHHLGLAHRPGDANSELTDSGIAGRGLYSKYTPLGYTDPDIDGFRIATDGMSGWNKSAVEGNAQHPSTLAPLMWPSPVSMESVWISDAEYRRLMDVVGP